MIPARFTVFAHFENTSLTDPQVRALIEQRSMHTQVVNAATPLKVWATLTADTLEQAVAAVVAAVRRVAPDAHADSVNGIEIDMDPILHTTGLLEVS